MDIVSLLGTRFGHLPSIPQIQPSPKNQENDRNTIYHISTTTRYHEALMAVPCCSGSIRTRTVVRRPLRSRYDTRRTPRTAGTNRRPPKIQNFHPAIPHQPKPGHRPRLCHRTHNVQEHLFQGHTVPYLRCIVICLSARISREAEVKKRCQVQKNDGLDELYRSSPLPAQFLESPPGRWGRNSRRGGEIAEKRPPVAP